MIFLWVLLVAFGVEDSKEIFLQTKPSPFKDLLVDVLENCHEPETVFFYGNVQDEIVQAAVDNNRKIQRLNDEDQIVAVNSKDLLVIFLDQVHNWSKRLAGAFIGINTVFVVVEELKFDQVKVIFADLWNASESANVFVFSKTEDGKSLQVVTFNPYGNYAPKGFWNRWKEQKIFFGRYSIDRRIDPCSILLFDRTKNLEDYPIQALQFLPNDGVKPMISHFLVTRKGSFPYVTIYPRLTFILSSLTNSLSVSVNLTNLIPLDEKLSSILIKSSLKKSVDLKIQPVSTRNTSLLSFYDPSYPFMTHQDVIVTHRLGLMTPLEKMFNFYGWLTIAATVKSNFSGSKIKRYFRQLKERLGPNYYRPVEFQDLFFIFVLLSVGLLVAILAFFGELAVQGWKDHQNSIRKRWRAVKRGVKIVRSMVMVKIKKWTRKPRKKRRSRS
ncbi:hypothetical protein KQX54_002696 [Cotesia glomerata]|uniref:Ionotropic receptor n=1 Tax=Cotesia glomerata TaxID=32391 RepID=A0AAV7IJJ3_COTGL|nr:hypothetical protein KQX54_002696 [Cotesia glomerata]